MKLFTNLAALLTFLFISTAAQSVSFDCSKASRMTETLICSDNDLSLIDDQINAAYKKALAVDPEVKSSQLSWIRDARNCEQEASPLECLKVSYKNRLNALNEILQSESGKKLPEISGGNEKSVESGVVGGNKSSNEVTGKANQTSNSKKPSESTTPGIADIVSTMVWLLVIFWLVRKLWRFIKGGTNKDKTNELPVSPETTLVNGGSLLANNVEVTKPAASIEGDLPKMIGKPNLTELFLSERSNVNSSNFDLLMHELGFDGNDILGFYFKDDPRYDPDEYTGLAGAWDVCLSTKREEKTKKILVSIHSFMRSPDVFTLWKFILLNHYATTDVHASSSVQFSSPFVLMEDIFGSVSNVIAAMKESRARFLSEQISEKEYQHSMQSLTLCYLATAFKDDEPYDCIRRLMDLIGKNEPLDEVCFDGTSWGEGEHMQACRRVVEELSGVRLEAPDGIDFEQDGYLDSVDWDEVAERVHSHLA